MTEENPLTAFSEKITKVYLVPDFLEVSRTTIERVVSEFQYPFAYLDFFSSKFEDRQKLTSSSDIIYDMWYKSYDAII